MSLKYENCSANFQTETCEGCEQLAGAVSAEVLDMSGIKGTRQRVLAETVSKAVVSIGRGEFPVGSLEDSPENRGRLSCDDRRNYIAKLTTELTGHQVVNLAAPEEN